MKNYQLAKIHHDIFTIQWGSHLCVQGDGELCCDDSRSICGSAVWALLGHLERDSVRRREITRDRSFFLAQLAM